MPRKNRSSTTSLDAIPEPAFPGTGFRHSGVTKPVSS